MKQYEYGNVAYIMKDVVLEVTVEHRDIINDYAAKGYRYAGMIPTEISANGCIRRMDLIFEKDGIL